MKTYVGRFHRGKLGLHDEEIGAESIGEAYNRLIEVRNRTLEAGCRTDFVDYDGGPASVLDIWNKDDPSEAWSCGDRFPLYAV